MYKYLTLEVLLSKPNFSLAISTSTVLPIVAASLCRPPLSFRCTVATTVPVPTPPPPSPPLARPATALSSRYLRLLHPLRSLALPPPSPVATSATASPTGTPRLLRIRDLWCLNLRTLIWICLISPLMNQKLSGDASFGGVLKVWWVLYRVRNVEVQIDGCKVERSELEAGDHIFSWRSKALFTYAHHGIYVGEDRVVHFNKGKSGPSCPCTASSTFPDCGFRKNESNGVTISCVKCFLNGGLLYRYKYGASTFALAISRGGTCTIAKSDAPEAVIHRAIYLLNNGFGKYSLLRQNCESFVIYCKTGLIVSKNIASGQVSHFVSLFTLSYLYRYWTDISVRKDAKKVEVESLAAFLANPSSFGKMRRKPSSVPCQSLLNVATTRTTC